MAQRTGAAFKTTKNSRYADNASGSITAANSRDMFEDTADSFLNISDHLLDEDDMASDSATKVPSQQSVKAYVDAQTAVGNVDTVPPTITEDFYRTTELSYSAWNAGGGLGAAPAASTFGEDATEKAFGVVECATSTSTAGGSTVYPGSSLIYFGHGYTHTFRCRGALGTLSDGTETYTMYIGFTSAPNATGDGVGAFFRYTHSVNSGRWQAVTDDGTETATDTGITAEITVFHIFEIIVNADATSVAFYIDGALVATNTTDIVSGSGSKMAFAFKIEKTAGSTSRSAYVDYIQYIPTRTTAR